MVRFLNFVYDSAVDPREFPFQGIHKGLSTLTYSVFNALSPLKSSQCDLINKINKQINLVAPFPLI